MCTCMYVCMNSQAYVSLLVHVYIFENFICSFTFYFVNLCWNSLHHMKIFGLYIHFHLSGCSLSCLSICLYLSFPFSSSCLSRTNFIYFYYATLFACVSNLLIRLLVRLSISLSSFFFASSSFTVISPFPYLLNIAFLPSSALFSPPHLMTFFLPLPPFFAKLLHTLLFLFFFLYTFFSFLCSPSSFPNFLLPCECSIFRLCFTSSFLFLPSLLLLPLLPPSFLPPPPPPLLSPPSSSLSFLLPYYPLFLVPPPPLPLPNILDLRASALSIKAEEMVLID